MRDAVSYEQKRQPVEYAPPPIKERPLEPSARNSTAVMLSEGVADPRQALETARGVHEDLEATGESIRVTKLKEEDATLLRSQAMADELASIDPENATEEDLQVLAAINNTDIEGDAFAYALPRVFANLLPEDSFNRLDGIKDDLERDDYVSRLANSELDFFEQAQIDSIERARRTAEKGASVSDVFASIGKGAEEGDDVIDAGLPRDIVNMMVPFLGQANLVKSYEEFTGRSVPATDAAFMGEVNNLLKNELLATPPELREQRGKQLVEIIQKNSGVFGLVEGFIDDPEARSFLQAVTQSDAEAYFNGLALSDTDFLTSDTDWARWLDNSFSLVDAATLGLATKVRQGARGVGRMFKLAKGQKATALRGLAVTDDTPKVKDMLALSMTDETGRLNPALGLTEEDHIGALLPNPKGDTTDPLPDYTQKVIDRNEQLASEIVTRRTRTDFFNDEVDALVRQTVDKFNRNIGGKLQPTRSQIGQIEGNNMEYIAQFGADEDFGFRTVAEAQQFADQRLGVDANIEILKRDPATGAYHGLDEGPTAGVEYVVRYDTKLNFPTEAAGELDPMTGAYGGLVRNNWIANAATKYDERIRMAVTRTTDDSAFVQQKLTDMMRPFDKLKRKDRQAVIELENNGAKEAKDYTFKELSTFQIDGRPLNAREMAGYYSRLQTRRALHQIENRALREKMVSQNFRAVRGEDFYGAARVINPEDISGNKNWAYNPTTGEVKAYRAEDLQDLYSVGGSLAELWRPITVKGHQVNKVLVDGANTKLNDLPTQVLRYIPGYQPRYYNARWFVRRKEMLRVDGELQETGVPVAASQSYADALNMVSRQDNPDQFTIDLDRVTAGGIADSESLNWELDNMMFYNQRSDQEIAALGGKSIVDDPETALRKSVNSVSGTLGSGRLLEVLQTKFRKTYGEVLPKDRKGNAVYPERKSDILRPGDPNLSRMYNEAKATHDYIRVISHGLSPLQKDFRLATLNLGATMEKRGFYGSGALSRVLYGLNEPELSPTAIARTAAFTTQILAAPLRQAWIQSHQALFLTGIDPGITLRSFLSDAFYLDSAFVLERANMHNKKWGGAVASSAKSTLGVTKNVPEMDNLYKNFANSGLPYLRSALVVEGVSDKILHTVGEFGYAAGERHNLAATYAFAYRRHLKNSGKSWRDLEDSDWEKIAFDAREYSLNMTRADAFNYQHGILSAATQYLSIRHKAINAVVSNKNFTPAERARIAGGQVLLFGAEGAGIGMVVDTIMNKMGITFEPVPEIGASALDVKQTIEGGMYDLVMNHTLQALLEQDEQSDVQFSRSMAALGEADRLIHAIFANQDNLALLDTAFGPSASAFSGAKRAISEVSMLVRMPDLSTEEKVTQSVEAFARVLSMGNNAVKTLAGERLMLAVDSKGRPITETTDVDMFIKRYFGFSTAQESEYYDNLGATGSRPGAGPRGVEGEIDEISDILAAMIRRETLQGNWDTAKRMTSSVLGLWSDDYERTAIMESLQTKLSDPSVANVELYKKLVSDLNVQSEDEIITKLINDSYMLRNPYQREKLKNFAEEIKERGNE